MPSIPAELRDLVATGPLAHLATINPDGSAQVTVIWIGMDGDRIVSGHLSLSQKVRNVQRDPRVVLSFDAPPAPGAFLAEHAVLRGTATVEEVGARDLLERLGKNYVGPDFEFPASADADGYVLRYSVDRIGGVGPLGSGPTLSDGSQAAAVPRLSAARNLERTLLAELVVARIVKPAALSSSGIWRLRWQPPNS